MAKKSTPTFEAAMAELDSIVEKMESDQLPIEELISHYERGASLLNQCETTLNSAKMRLETIKNTGTNASSNSASAKSSKKSTTTPSSNDDDIRLF